MDEIKKKIKEYCNYRSSSFDNSIGYIIANRREETAWKSHLQEKNR